MKMKKILSSVLVAATLASMMVFPATAEVKSVTQEIDVLRMPALPNFDGDITAEEWGDVSFTVTGNGAAKPGDTAPSAQNTFAWYEFEYDTANKEIKPDSIDQVNKAKTEEMSYDVWLRWDDKYLYIAAKVNDPDGYYLPAGREKIWDGDCVQFRVDPMGPNAYLSYKDSAYDYKAVGFDTTSEATSGISYMPWAYSTKICNIGMGSINGDLQIYDMADQGTGNMTKPQKLNDPNKLGPGKNPLKDDNDYASLFGMKTCDENGNGISTYECAVPWAFIDQWGLGQVAVGYAWGMSLVVLNGYDDGDSLTSPFMSYLTWGSGICGAQQEEFVLRPTCGGSNAIILSDMDINGKKVEGLDYATDNSGSEQSEVVHKIIDASGMSAYYLPGPATVVDGDFELSMDIAYTGDDPINPNRTYVGVWLGEEYGMAAGWGRIAADEDGDKLQEGKFFVGTQNFNNGIDTSIPPAESEDIYNWPAGEWHNLGIKVLDDTVTITFDGKVVLVDTDKRNTSFTAGSTGFQAIVYNIGDFVYDNYKFVTGGEEIFYTCDSDDEAFNRSDFQLTALPMAHDFVKGECQKVNPASKYGCLMHADVNADGKPVMKCDFCGTEEEMAFQYGDVNGDNFITIADVTMMLKVIAKWSGIEVDMTIGDVNCDNFITIADVTMMLKVIAKWEGIVLGPQ